MYKYAYFSTPSAASLEPTEVVYPKNVLLKHAKSKFSNLTPEQKLLLKAGALAEVPFAAGELWLGGNLLKKYHDGRNQALENINNSLQHISGHLPKEFEHMDTIKDTFFDTMPIV